MVLRLARFNALLDDGSQPAYAREFFVGMPAPAGAVSIIGSIIGCIGGILVLGVINNGLLITGVSPYLQKIIKGAIIVVAVVFDMRKIARKK